MTNAEYSMMRDYKRSLYPNLLAACVMSENKEKTASAHPGMAVKDCPELQSCPLICHRQTFIMRWNPEISNHKVADFEHAMEDFYNEGFYYDWSIFDYEKVHEGDRFFMLKVGNGNTGIVMSGIIASMPHIGEDWSGKGRIVRYVRMIPDCMIHPDCPKMVTIKMLDDAFPGMDWNEGHSGVMLSDGEADRFNEVWERFMESL